MTTKRTRCPNGTRKNKKTGNCEGKRNNDDESVSSALSPSPVVFVPTLYFLDDNKPICIVVGVFKNKKDAIKSLFQKMIEEDFVYCDEKYKEDEDKFYKFINMLYNNFYQKIKNSDDNLLNGQLENYFTYEKSKIYNLLEGGFGEDWGCRIEVYEIGQYY